MTRVDALVPAFVINLDGHESKFDQVLSRLGKCLNVERVLDGPVRFKAIDIRGKMKQFADFVKTPSALISLFAAQTMMMGERRYHCQLTSEGAIGCYLSHYNLWKKCVELQKPILVMEDDVAFSDPETLAEILSEVNSVMGDEIEFVSFDFINHYSVSAKAPVKTIKTGSSKLHRIVRPFWGCAMYMIHPRGAQALIQTAFPIEIQVDSYIALRGNPDLCEMLNLKPVLVYGILNSRGQRLAFQQTTSSTIQRNDCPKCETGLGFTNPNVDPDEMNKFGSTFRLDSEGPSRRGPVVLHITIVTLIVINLILLALFYRKV